VPIAAGLISELNELADHLGIARLELHELQKMA
jgi:hypothetical protein